MTMKRTEGASRVFLALPPPRWSRLLTLALTLGCAGVSAAQQPESGTRGLFLETRPTAAAAKKGQAQAPLALGYTLFLQTPEGTQRVSVSRTFRNGDRVRLLVESNRDAYLYIFHQEMNGSATLIFPDARVNGGNNRIGAHVPEEVPSSGAFVFDERPGKELLTVFLSEQPLPNVPRGTALAEQSFTLSSAALEELLQRAQPSDVEAERAEGHAMTGREATRGMKLTTADPAPANVVMKKARQPGWVAARIRLIHR
jgi:hypothetical protein